MAVLLCTLRFPVGVLALAPVAAFWLAAFVLETAAAVVLLVGRAVAGAGRGPGDFPRSFHRFHRNLLALWSWTFAPAGGKDFYGGCPSH